MSPKTKTQSKDKSEDSPALGVLRHIKFTEDHGLRTVSREYTLPDELSEKWVFVPYIEALAAELVGADIASDERRPRVLHPTWNVKLLLAACGKSIERIEGKSNFGFFELNDHALIEKLIKRTENKKTKAHAHAYDIEGRLSEPYWLEIGGAGVAPFPSQVIAGYGLIVLDAAIDIVLRCAQAHARGIASGVLPKESSVLGVHTRRYLTDTLMRVVYFMREAAQCTIRQNIPIRKAIWNNIDTSGTATEKRRRDWEKILPHLEAVRADKPELTSANEYARLIRRREGKRLGLENTDEKTDLPDFPKHRPLAEMIHRHLLGSKEPWKGKQRITLQKRNKIK
jgi:hypothetical protein